jgi:hypothetical protein
MSEMQEKVTGVLMGAFEHIPDKDYRRIIAGCWARAAIEAMRELPGEPGPRYTSGEYSRRTQAAMVDDALS